MRGRDEEPDRVHQEALTSTPHLAVTAATQPVVRVPDAVVVDQATVGEYVEAVMELFMQGPPDRVVPGQDLLGLEGFLLLERSRPAVSDAQHIHNKLLYDAVNEALVHFFSLAARRQPAPAWIRRLQPLRRLPQGPELTAAVKQRVMKWAAQQHDEHVDAMLAEDAVEDDRTWAIIEEEEAEVRFDISEAIWDDLIADTADTLLLLHG
ncbi:hypothetical protein WJX72_003771 [[Myrmecia] bisecta]|uniref:DUF4378 domain-containing protein n=1 Tax=[Myrmecia] bisecta TaxID=41462 RepID=A0AAW1NXY8_9CHLO